MKDKCINKENLIKQLPRLKQLDSFRFIMCLVVVISHFEFLQNSVIGDIYTTYLKRGQFAVDYFFILSGFGIYYSTKEDKKKCSLKNSLLYAINKIQKIYPIYIVSLIIGLAYTIPSILNCHSLINFWGKLAFYFATTLTLTQSLFGITTFSHAINGVCWFLSSLFISYLFCPIFIKIVNKAKSSKHILLSLIIVISIIFGLSFTAYSIDNLQLLNGKIDDLYYGHPFIRCFYLLIGMYLSKLYNYFKNKVNKSTFLEICILIIYLLYFFYRTLISNCIHCCIVRLFDIVITSALILSFSFGKGKISHLLSKNTIVNLGNDAMYIYLFHYPIRMILDVIDTRILLVNYCGQFAYAIQIFIIGCLTFASVILIKIIRPWLDKRFNFILKKFIK